MDSMSNIHSEIKVFCQNYMLWIVLELPDEVLQEYKDLFSYFDRDGGGSIGVEELGQVMRAFKWTPTNSDLKVV